MVLRLTNKEFLASPAVPVSAHRWQRDGDYPDHDHEFMEIVVIVGGRGQHLSIQGAGRIAKGDVIVLRPGTWHGYRACRALRAYDLLFGMEMLHRELAFVLHDPALSRLFWSGPLAQEGRGMARLHLPGEALARCEARLRALHAAGRPGRAPSPAECVGNLLLILHELGAATGTGERRGSAPQERTHPAVVQGVRLLESQLAREWALSDLAGEVFLDASYLTRLFKAATGLPPLAYLARCRAERAAALLLRTAVPVAEIGLQVGWPDPNYFARRFRQHFGLSASQYRRRFSGVADGPSTAP
jgi:AraC family L-rhamnose operon transcriptional activator RhaR